MNERLLFIVAHSDDPEIWSGGTIINHSKNNDKICFYYLYCNDKKRKQEAIENANKLDIETYFDNKKINLEFISRFNPSIIITHWKHDSHHEHASVYELVNNAFPKLVIDYQLSFSAFSCDCYNSLGHNMMHLFTPTDYIDITDAWEDKLKLIESYSSQPVHFWKDMITNQNKIHGARCGVSYAEAFIQISVLGVARRSNFLLKG